MQSGLPSWKMTSLPEILEPGIELLTRVKIDEPMNRWRAKKVIWLPDTSTLADALRVLDEHKILSLPVRDPESNEWTGFVDYAGILAFTLKTVTGEQDDERMQWGNYSTDPGLLDKKGELLASSQLKDLIAATSKDWKFTAPFYPVSRAGNLFQVVEEIFCKGVHRVPVVEDDNRLVGILSQSDVCAAIVANLDEIGTLASSPISLFKMGESLPITMSENAPAITAFFLMIYNKVSAVAIVDAEDKLVANLSLRDLRGLNRTNLGSLLQPVGTYLRKAQLSRDGQSPSELVTCGKHSLFGDVLHSMAKNRLHRVWVVDEGKHVKGVVTLTDVCSFLACTRPPTGPDIRRRTSQSDQT